MEKTREVIGSCPLDCPDGCSWIVTVEDGVATKLRGNPDHPFTRGGLCKKVNPWLDYAVDPGRLLHPMRRIKAKGSDEGPEDAFERISWDEALSEIANRFGNIIETSGPAAIWPFAGTGNVGFVQGGALPAGGRLWNHLGVSGHQISICSVSGHVGLGYSVGTATGFDPEDIAHAGTVMIWGSNTLVANQHLWPFIEKARAAGAPLVVIDPVRTRTAARADLHIAPRVGTDGALALGLCRFIIESGAVDPSFVAERTEGFEPFAQSVEQWTPERTAETCGLDLAEFETLAALLTKRSPLAIKLGQGMQRHAFGGQTARIISCLPALTGAFAQRGGGLVYSTSGPYALNVDAAGGVDLGSRPRDLAMTHLAKNLMTLDDPPIEALFIHGANPVVSNPDTAAVRRALSRPDLFTVAVELFHTETTDYADIVLPSTMQHEHLEVNDSFSHLYVQLNQPAVAPPGECLAHTEIFRRLATAMELDEPALYASDEELAAALFDTPAYASAGITLESLRETGWARLPATESPYLPFAQRFPTPSGRFEFASPRAEQENHGLVPSYTAPAEAGNASRPESGSGRRAGYDLVAAASDWHVNSVFAGTVRTLARTTEPTVAVNPADAERDSLVDGARVEVANERGSFSAVLAVDASVRPGLAVTTKGWWRMGVNNTVAERDSDMGRGAVYHDNYVAISPLNPADPAV
ncbi:MAG: molybdopterin-containing oxidoreductase family protein [Acidimicrobiales bacterium]